MLWIFRYLRTSGDNFHEVVPGRIYRSATPSPENLEKWYRKYGIRTWIDLRQSTDFDGDRARNYAAQIAMCEQLGIERIWVPISDRTPTGDLEIRRCLDTLTALSKSAVLVACQGGRHRAGLIIALYRVRVQMWKARDAFKEAEKRGFYDAMHVDFGRHFRKLLGLLLVLLMALPATAQTKHPFIQPALRTDKETLTVVVEHPESKKFDRSYWIPFASALASSGTDWHSTHGGLERGGLEANPVFRTNGGRGVNWGANVAVTAGFLGYTAWLEHKGHRRTARALLYLLTVLRVVASVHNYSVRRGRAARN